MLARVMFLDSQNKSCCRELIPGLCTFFMHEHISACWTVILHDPQDETRAHTSLMHITDLFLIMLLNGLEMGLNMWDSCGLRKYSPPRTQFVVLQTGTQIISQRSNKDTKGTSEDIKDNHAVVWKLHKARLYESVVSYMKSCLETKTFCPWHKALYLSGTQHCSSP